MEGVARPLVSMGKLVKDDNGKPIEKREYSDHLLTTLLKGHRPLKYRENVSIGGTVTHELSERMDNAIKRLEAINVRDTVEPPGQPPIVIEHKSRRSK